MPVPASPHNIVFGKVFADAGALWRSERELLVPLAGVFSFLPQLATAMLFATSKSLATAENFEVLWKALVEFYLANFVWLILLNIVTSFGNFAVLNLFLQGRGRTLGEVLVVALRGFLPFLAMDVLLLLGYGMGLSLFILPGAFLFCRTWLAAPAYAAAPERGLLGALSDSWIRSGGLNGLMVLVSAAIVMLASTAATTIARALLAPLGKLFGAADAFVVLDYAVSALLGSAAWIAFAVLRVALYRASAPRHGM